MGRRQGLNIQRLTLLVMQQLGFVDTAVGFDRCGDLEDRDTQRASA